MTLDVSRIILTLINFGILFFVLKHFLFKRISETVEARESEIKTRIHKSIEDQSIAEKLKLENQELLKTASAEGKSIVETYKVKAEKVSKDILEQAKKDAQQNLERGKQELDREVEKATAEIRAQVVDLAVLLSTQALGETIDEIQHRKLIQQFIAKVGI